MLVGLGIILSSVVLVTGIGSGGSKKVRGWAKRRQTGSLRI
jgi:hypothetical protein